MLLTIGNGLVSLSVLYFDTIMKMENWLSKLISLKSLFLEG